MRPADERAEASATPKTKPALTGPARRELLEVGKSLASHVAGPDGLPLLQGLCEPHVARGAGLREMKEGVNGLPEEQHVARFNHRFTLSDTGYV